MSRAQLVSRLVPLDDFCRENPQFRMGTLRRFIFHNRRNIRHCLVRFGRRLLLDVDAFERWVLEGRESDHAEN